MYTSTLTTLLAAAALMASASAAPSTRRAGTLIGQVDGGTGPQPLTLLNNPDSLAFGFNLKTIEITLSGASCALFTGRAGNDANGNVACDSSTHVADVFSGDGTKDVSNLNITCVFCSF